MEWQVTRVCDQQRAGDHKGIFEKQVSPLLQVLGFMVGDTTLSLAGFLVLRVTKGTWDEKLKVDRWRFLSIDHTE